MRSTTSSVPAPGAALSSSRTRRTRRSEERRSRRRPVVLACGLAAAVAVTAGFVGVSPVSSASATGAEAPSFVLASYSTASTGSASSAFGVTTGADADARAALSAAEAAEAAAASVTADIAASGLDIGVPDTSVDTSALEAAADRLDDGTAVLPDALVPDLTAQLTVQVDTVGQKVAALRGSLDAAVAAKAQAEAEAAAKAKAEAEAAAAAKSSSSSSGSSGGSSTPFAAVPSGGGSGDNSPAGAQASAYAMFPGYGWGDDQFGCLVALWNRESGWNYQSYNSGSGAGGIPQALPASKMASAGADWQTNAATQVAWGLGYIAGRYGTPCGAWNHSESVGWY